MLQLIRDRAQGIVVWVIVGLIIITFALFGLSSYLSGSATVNVATVNDKEISQNEFIRAYQNYQNRLQEVFGKNYRPEMFDENAIKQQVLDSLVTREVVSHHLDVAGFNTAPEQVLANIHSMKAFFDENGQFSSKQYKRTLALQGLNSVLFEQSIAKDIADDNLQNGIVKTASLTPKQKQAMARLLGQQRDIEYLRINHDAFIKTVKVSDEDIQKYYSENSTKFSTPEMVSVSYLELDINQVAGQFDIEDKAVRDYYDQNKKLYESQPEQRKASHILLTVDSNTDDAAAKKLADEIIARINKGESFAELAKQYSKDPGSANKGGDLGFFGRGIMDPAFETATFSLNKGEVSEPVKSAFGYHIIKLTDIKQGELASFDSVKAKIKSELQLQKAEQRFYEDIDKLNNLTYETPDSLLPAADALGLKVKESSLFSRNGGKGIFANPKVVNAAFSEEVLNRGRNSEMVELGDTHLVVLRVKEHKASSVLPLDEVKDQLLAELKRNKAIEKARELAASVSQQLADKSARNIASAEKSISLEKPGLIGRVAKQDSKLPGEIRSVAFTMAKPSGKPGLKQVALSNGDQAIVILNNVTDGESLEEKEYSSLERAYGTANFENYITFLRSEADIELHTEAIKAN